MESFKGWLNENGLFGAAGNALAGALTTRINAAKGDKKAQETLRNSEWWNKTGNQKFQQLQKDFSNNPFIQALERSAEKTGQNINQASQVAQNAYNAAGTGVYNKVNAMGNNPLKWNQFRDIGKRDPKLVDRLQGKGLITPYQGDFMKGKYTSAADQYLNISPKVGDMASSIGDAVNDISSKASQAASSVIPNVSGGQTEKQRWATNPEFKKNYRGPIDTRNSTPATGNLLAANRKPVSNKPSVNQDIVSYLQSKSLDQDYAKR